MNMTDRMYRKKQPRTIEGSMLQEISIGCMSPLLLPLLVMAFGLVAAETAVDRFQEFKYKRRADKIRALRKIAEKMRVPDSALSRATNPTEAAERGLSQVSM